MKTIGSVMLLGALTLGLTSIPAAFADDDDEDHAVTAWAFIFQDPENCTGPCDNIGDVCAANGFVTFLTGQRVGEDSVATFAGPLAANSDYRIMGPCNPANRLTDVMKAEIHIGLDDHGPGSLDGSVMMNHQEVTNPGNPQNIIQFVIFESGAGQGNVMYSSTGAIVPGSAAAISRAMTGASISVATGFDFDDDDDDDDDEDDDD